MEELSLIYSYIFMCINENYQELVWQKFENLIMNTFTLNGITLSNSW